MQKNCPVERDLHQHLADFDKLEEFELLVEEHARQIDKVETLSDWLWDVAQAGEEELWDAIWGNFGSIIRQQSDEFPVPLTIRERACIEKDARAAAAGALMRFADYLVRSEAEKRAKQSIELEKDAQ